MARWSSLIVFLVCGVLIIALANPGVFGRPHRSPLAWSGSPGFSAQRAWTLAETLAVRFPRRWSGSTDRRASADWLAGVLTELGLDVDRDTFSVRLGTAGWVAMENVWGISRGHDRAGELVVALGNYDMAPTSYQAASDTAAHVGTLLELARVIHSAPHRRTFVFLFPDGEEWGMLGARHFVRTFSDRARIVAAFSIEDLDPGPMRALGIDGVGQFRGFAPMWMRGLAASAAHLEGVPVEDATPLVEWLRRSLLVSFTDQGPFLERGIPAVDLAGRGADQALADAIFHGPGDTIDKMHPDAFRLYGRIHERILRAVDAIPDVPRETRSYLRLGPDRIVPAGPLLGVQLGVFLPLVVTLISTSRRARLSLAVLVAESRALWSMFVVLVTGLAVIKMLPRLGLMPWYELYPPPTPHPETTTVPWAAITADVVIALGVGSQLWRWSRRPGPGRTGATTAATWVALMWLPVVAGIGLCDNPFGAVTFLLLPVLCWIWIEPLPSALRRLGNAVLLALGSLALVLLVVQHAGMLRLGPYILWYVMMGLAYGQFSLLRILLALATITIGLRLLALTVLRRPARSGSDAS